MSKKKIAKNQREETKIPRLTGSFNVASPEDEMSERKLLTHGEPVLFWSCNFSILCITYLLDNGDITNIPQGTKYDPKAKNGLDLARNALIRKNIIKNIKCRIMFINFRVCI